MKATLEDGTILEGTVEEIKTVIEQKAAKEKVETVLINEVPFRATPPKNYKRPYKRKNGSSKRIQKACAKYALNEATYRKALLDSTLGFEDIAKQFGIPGSVVHACRFLLRKEGIVTFKHAHTKANLEVYAGLRKRMKKAGQLVENGSAKTMSQALKMLAKQRVK